MATVRFGKRVMFEIHCNCGPWSVRVVVTNALFHQAIDAGKELFLRRNCIRAARATLLCCIDSYYFRVGKRQFLQAELFIKFLSGLRFHFFGIPDAKTILHFLVHCEQAEFAHVVRGFMRGFMRGFTLAHCR